ncbi:MAG: hypothetical protein RTV72_07895 [Candidatus Thorarchaeota archaeon]
MVQIVDRFPKPFALMKHGLEGYGGEYCMWKHRNLTFLHIFVRIAEERKRVNKPKLDFYPYLVTTENIHTLDSLEDNENPIIIYFTPERNKIDTWPEKMPDVNQIKWDCDDESRHTRLYHPDFGTLKIPCPIRIGDGTEEKYKALLIDKLEHYTWGQRVVLKFEASNCVHISERSRKPIKQSWESSLPFGVYENCDDSSKTSGDYSRDVVAHAILKPPYYCDVLP